MEEIWSCIWQFVRQLTVREEEEKEKNEKRRRNWRKKMKIKTMANLDNRALLGLDKLPPILEPLRNSEGERRESC